MYSILVLYFLGTLPFCQSKDCFTEDDIDDLVEDLKAYVSVEIHNKLEEWSSPKDTNVKPGDCFNYGQSQNYNGTQSTTISGRKCQKWNTDFPHKRGEQFIPKNSQDRETNFCRGNRTPWCYTTDPDVRWEYCPIPICDCYKFGKSQEYDGVQSTTISGRTCQNWNTDIPHKRTTKFIPKSYKDKQSNYCRDTSDAGALWCYTTDPDVRWEFCSVPVCY